MKPDLQAFEDFTNDSLALSVSKAHKDNMRNIKDNNPLHVGGGVTIPEPSDAGKHAVGISMSSDTIKDIKEQLAGQFNGNNPTSAIITHNKGGRKTKRTKRKTKRKTKKAKRKTKKAKRKTKRKTKRTKRKTKGCNCRNCKCACCLKKRKRKRR
jgi:hypothetical protein